MDHAALLYCVLYKTAWNDKECSMLVFKSRCGVTYKHHINVCIWSDKARTHSSAPYWVFWSRCWLIPHKTRKTVVMVRGYKWKCLSQGSSWRTWRHSWKHHPGMRGFRQSNAIAECCSMSHLHFRGIRHSQCLAAWSTANQTDMV